MAGAMPGIVAADECPVAINATTPYGVLIAKILVLTESLLGMFVTTEWNAANQTCNVTGLTDNYGAPLVISLGEIGVYSMKIVADIMRMAAGGGH